MAKSKQQRYEVNRKSLHRYNDEGYISDTELELILEVLDANDPDRHMTQNDNGETKSPGTLVRYSRDIGRVARDLDKDLSEATSDDINRLMQGYITGEVESTKEGGLKKSTVVKNAGNIRVFYRYHQDRLGVEPEEINMPKPDNHTVDERDIFDKDDVQAIREEAKNSGVRDAALIDLLLYTGQRRSAILNLRLKDVNPDEGTFYLNEDDGDLKGASGKRPLLGAQKSVRDLKRQHPTGEPDHYLITSKLDISYKDGVEKGDKLDGSTVYYLLQRIGKNAGVDKPIHAHNFRHFFVTSCVKNYNMDKDTIKHLIGHEPDSTVMESTYQHLTDDDYIQKAEEKTGIKEPDDESPLTPSTCDRCGEPLEGDFKACPYCGYTYAPDAYEAKEKIEDDIYQDKGETEHGSPESEAVDELREMLKEKPELVAELIDED